MERLMTFKTQLLTELWKCRNSRSSNYTNTWLRRLANDGSRAADCCIRLHSCLYNGCYPCCYNDCYRVSYHGCYPIGASTIYDWIHLKDKTNPIKKVLAALNANVDRLRCVPAVAHGLQHEKTALCALKDVLMEELPLVFHPRSH